MTTPYDAGNTSVSQAILAFAQSIRTKLDNPLAKDFLQYVHGLPATTGGVLTRVPQNGATPPYWTFTEPSAGGTNLQTGVQPTNVPTIQDLNDLEYLLATRYQYASYMTNAGGINDNLGLMAVNATDAFYNSTIYAVPIDTTMNSFSDYASIVRDGIYFENTNVAVSHEKSMPSRMYLNGLIGLLYQPDATFWISSNAPTRIVGGADASIHWPDYFIEVGNSASLTHAQVRPGNLIQSYFEFDALAEFPSEIGRVYTVQALVRRTSNMDFYIGVVGPVADGNAYVNWTQDGTKKLAVKNSANLLQSRSLYIGRDFYLVSATFSTSTTGSIKGRVGVGDWGSTATPYLNTEWFIVAGYQIHSGGDFVSPITPKLNAVTYSRGHATFASSAVGQYNNGDYPTEGASEVVTFTMFKKQHGVSRMRVIDISTRDDNYVYWNLFLTYNRLTDYFEIVVYEEQNELESVSFTKKFRTDSILTTYYSIDVVSGNLTFVLSGVNSVTGQLDKETIVFSNRGDIIKKYELDTNISSGSFTEPGLVDTVLLTGFHGLVFTRHYWKHTVPINELEKLTHCLYLK